LVAYTPWKNEDAYGELERSGLFRQMTTPAFVEDEKSGVEFNGKKVRLTCPKVYPLAVLEQQYKLLGEREFGRQLLCRLDFGKSTSLPYYPYVTSGAEYGYPAYGGADPTGAEPDFKSKGKKRSFFALAYAVKLPQGGALILDGILEQCSHVEAENHILNAQNLFQHWNFTMVENVGPGLVFFQNARRNSNLRVISSDLMSLDEKDRRRSQSKNARILQMAKWFENGTVKIAARATPFLDSLRFLFDHFWELNEHEPHPAWDAGDAVYHALKGMPDVTIVQSYNQAGYGGISYKSGMTTPWALGGSVG
jgi:hypothetical protein